MSSSFSPSTLHPLSRLLLALLDRREDSLTCAEYHRRKSSLSKREKPMRSLPSLSSAHDPPSLFSDRPGFDEERARGSIQSGRADPQRLERDVVVGGWMRTWMKGKEEEGGRGGC